MPARTPQEADRMIGEALARRDVDAALELFEPDAVLVDPDTGAHLRGRQEIRAGVLAMLDDDISLTESRPPTILISGDIALVLSHWMREVTGPDGERLQQSGTGTDVLRRQPDGTWRYVIDNPSGTDAPAEQAGSR